MKAIKYFLYALIATFVFAGCSDDPTYTRGESEADGCYGVYFPSQDNAADLELDPADPTVLTFTAMRTNDADAITVPVTVTGSEDAIFSASEIVRRRGDGNDLSGLFSRRRNRYDLFLQHPDRRQEIRLHLR